MENYSNNRNFNQYKTVEQLVKIGKARTKPVSVRLNVDTIDYFEKNAKKFNTKTGTIISDVLDDYVRNLRHAEMRNRMETETSLISLYRRATGDEGQKFLIRNLIDRTSHNNSITIDGEEIQIVKPEQHAFNGKTTSVFYLEDSKGQEQRVDEIADRLKKNSDDYDVCVEALNGSSDSDYILDLGAEDDLFIVLGDCALIPRNIDLIYSPDYTFGGESLFVIPIKDWALITSFLIECATIKTRQLGREIRIYSLMLYVMGAYNKTKEKADNIDKPAANINKYGLDRIVAMRYRELIREMARYEDLPTNYEWPKDLDEDNGNDEK